MTEKEKLAAIRKDLKIPDSIPDSDIFELLILNSFEKPKRRKEEENER